MRRCTIVAAAAALLPDRASAHLAASGLGPLYDGLAHPFVTPARMLPLLGVSLAAALAGRRRSRLVLLVLPGAWLVGTEVGLLAGDDGGSGVLPGAIAMVFGGLAALAARPPARLLAGLAALAGLALGVADGVDVGAAGQGTLAALGIAATAAAVVTVVAGHGVRAAAGPSRIALRVGGSWIAAAGVLCVGWALRRYHLSF